MASPAEKIAAKHNAGIGHNSVAKDKLKAFVERIERLEEEKKAAAEDIREVYKEAKGTGLEPKALRRIVRERAKPPDPELEVVVDTYKLALGMLDT